MNLLQMNSIEQHQDFQEKEFFQQLLEGNGQSIKLECQWKLVRT